MPRGFCVGPHVYEIRQHHISALCKMCNHDSILTNIASASFFSGPILRRMFCSALDTSLGGCWCELRKQGEARTEDARTHAHSLEIQGKGECKAVLEGISSCLECSDSSLQVCIFSRTSTNHFRDEMADRLLWENLRSHKS